MTSQVEKRRRIHWWLVDYFTKTGNAEMFPCYGIIMGTDNDQLMHADVLPILVNSGSGHNLLPVRRQTIT